MARAKKKAQYEFHRSGMLDLKVQGETFGLIQLGDVRKRLDAALARLTKDRALVADVCERYGAHAFVEQLDDDVLIRIANSRWLWGDADFELFVITPEHAAFTAGQVAATRALLEAAARGPFDAAEWTEAAAQAHLALAFKNMGRTAPNESEREGLARIYAELHADDEPA